MGTIFNWIMGWFAKKELADIVDSFDKQLGHLDEYESRMGDLAAGKAEAIKSLAAQGKEQAAAALHAELGDHLLDIREASMIKNNLKLLLGKD